MVNQDDLRGGVVLRELPVLPFESFMQFGVRVFDDGKIKPAIFTPNMEEIDMLDVFLLSVFLTGISRPRKVTGPVDWNTVPANIQRHFTVVDETKSVKPLEIPE